MIIVQKNLFGLKDRLLQDAQKVCSNGQKTFWTVQKKYNSRGRQEKESRLEGRKNCKIQLRSNQVETG